MVRSWAVSAQSLWSCASSTSLAFPPKVNQIDCSHPQSTQFSFAAGMWELLCARPELRVLLAGPTGSGKTTVGELIKRSVNPKGPHIDLENVVTPTIGMNIVRARLGAADMTVMDVGGTVSALLCAIDAGSCCFIALRWTRYSSSFTLWRGAADALVVAAVPEGGLRRRGIRI
jgi:hypothetical protein